MPHWINSVFYGLTNGVTFGQGLTTMLLSIKADNIFTGDQLVTF